MIGGWPDPKTGQVLYGIEIPKLLSLLAHRDPDALVVGLDAFPPGDAADPRMVHPFFDLMIGSFFLMFVTAACYWWQRWRRRETQPGRMLLGAVLCASPLGILALESGWLVTEFGRQPWIIQGYMRVSQAVTPTGGMGLLLGTFLILYLALTIGLLWVLFGPFRSEEGKGSFGNRGRG